MLQTVATWKGLEPREVFADVTLYEATGGWTTQIPTGKRDQKKSEVCVFFCPKKCVFLCVFLFDVQHFFKPENIWEKKKLDCNTTVHVFLSKGTVSCRVRSRTRIP